ncbi:UNKNOWN [Stylonychia lemnae]|uniref:Uncharacterized protein n=1 Tax=Stylonychia lemnae TaxID=5949 RepID=A0A078AU07_STYLE|nr:UNKNOWN [Stylonychia lemnae]|eukprot:CDW85739.1 UNKNOWN [Stylonychia lemnae]
MVRILSITAPVYPILMRLALWALLPQVMMPSAAILLLNISISLTGRFPNPARAHAVCHGCLCQCDFNGKRHLHSIQL